MTILKSGHDFLLEDLNNLLREAENFEFDDFKYKKYATPKVELYRKLLLIANNVKKGKYDQ